MRAVILAGGKGTRLLPFTTLIPKPLVPLGGRYSVLEIVLMQLARAGFERATLAVNHLSQLVQAYFGDGSRWQIKLDYSLEDQPLGTIGPLTQIADLPDHFLVMNGDILCDLDYRAFFEGHASRGSDISVGVHRRSMAVDFGVLRYDKNCELTGFEEKPSLGFDVSMGVYCIARRVVAALPKGRPYGFDSLMLDSLKQGRRVKVVPFDGYWLDIGRTEDYDYANEHFDKLVARLGLGIS